MSKVSIRSQIAAVESAAGDRPGPSHPAQRDLQREHLRSAAATLRWLAGREADIRAFVAEREGKQQ